MSATITISEFNKLEERIEGVEMQVRSVGLDVSEIKAALVGSKIYPGGMAESISRAQKDIKLIEKEVQFLKEAYKMDRNYVLGIAAAVAACVSITAWLLIFLYK
jgi:hypothetical protein